MHASRNDSRYDESVHHATIVKAWSRTIQDSIMFVFVFVTTCYILCRQKNRTPVVIVQLCLLNVAYFGINIRNFWKTLTGDYSTNDETGWIWYPFSISEILWLT